jgi:hypothetical protein
MPSQSEGTDRAYAAYVVAGGLLAVVAVFAAAVVRYDDATAVSTAMAPVTGVIAALVGAYFGIRGASMAQEKANQSAHELARIQHGAPAADVQPAAALPAAASPPPAVRSQAAP